MDVKDEREQNKRLIAFLRKHLAWEAERDGEEKQ